jgi:DNA-binding response OmpR family regulator
MKILVADPNAVQRRILLHMLAELGWNEVVEAGTPEAARRLLVRMALSFPSEPTVLFLEWNASETQGLPLVRWIRSRTELQHVFIVAMSEMVYSRDVVTALTSGVDHFLIRPFKPDVLEDRLHALEARAKNAAFLEATLPLAGKLAAIQ